jgi:assimilatory nitrate reductase catalytic subunit
MNMSVGTASLQAVCKQTTCPYCGVGCGVDASLLSTPAAARAELSAVKGSEAHPANFGRLCVKGSALHEAVGLPGRLLHPEIAGERASWDTALDTVAARFAAVVAEHGPDAVAFYLSGQLLTEDYYVANKLMKGFIGSANVDTNSRLCMASAVAGYKRALGADAVPCNYEDLECCDLLVMIGSNAAWTHPVLYQRISAAKEARPGLRIVVIDPRRTATCDIADLHLPLQPGSDAYLFNGLLHWLLLQKHVDQGWVDAHCEGFIELETSLQGCDLAWCATHTGLSEAQLSEFFQLYAATEKTVSFYSQGINQSATGTDKCNAIINCHLVTGRIGREGMGPFSITGQPNAMGGREVGGLANQLAAHMDFTPEAIARVGRFWQAPQMASTPGLKAVDMFRAVREGRIKALWIMGTNPAVSLPEADTVHEALRNCPFVVVSDCVRHTETTQYAHVLLPATGWSEKDGTVTNSERRISRQRALLIPAGEARHDWQIVSQVAERMGFGSAFAYCCPRDVFVEHAALSGFENSGQRAFDISALQALDAVAYEQLEPVQWPLNAANPTGTARMFGDGRFYTPSGKARLLPVQAQAPAVATSGEFPWLLNTGRLRDQWHTMTRTGTVPRLLQHTPSPFVAIHPASALSAGITDGDLVHVTSPHGAVLLPAKLDEGQRRGEVFVPIHWNDRFASHARVGSVIGARTDPWSGQPESKLEAVALQPLPMARWMLLVINREVPQQVLDGVAELAYWERRPVLSGWCYRLALRKAPSAASLQLLKSAFGAARVLEFHDESSFDHRMAFMDAGTVQGVLFSAARHNLLPQADWTQALLQRETPDDEWLLLAGRELDAAPKGALICSCHEVGEEQIEQAIRGGCADVQSLGKQLRCGTGCGSCIPELKNIIARTRAQLGTEAATVCADVAVV